MLPSSLLPTWRQPTVRLMANSTPIAGVLAAEVVANNYYAADQFRMSLALGADPVATTAYWAEAANILFDLQYSLDGMGFVSLIQGHADEITLDLLGGSIEVRGRDLTAGLIEARTQETFSNRTASEIAALLALRHGLTPVVTVTTAPVGRYYQNEHDRITLDQFSHATTEWDLLVFLARQEGFDVFVQGTTLYFQPRPATSPPSVVVRPDMLTDLKMRRSLTLARDLEVTVKSWNSRQKNAFVQTVRAQGSVGSRGVGSAPQQYVYVRPNLTPNQALQFAETQLAELSLHERVIDLRMPGELTLTPRSTLLIDGTGTDFDQVYFIDSIEREIRPDRGYTQRIRAKNTSPRTQTTTPGDTVGAVTG